MGESIQRGRQRRRPRRGDGSVYQRSDGRWEGKLYRGRDAAGKPRFRKVVGGTEAQAHERLARLRDEIRQGADAGDGNLTVGAWLEAWLEEIPRAVSAGTVDNYRNVVRYYVAPILGSKRLAKLRPVDVHDMLTHLEHDGRSPNTMRLARSILRRALRVAQSRGLVAQNAAALVDGPKVAGSSPGRTLSPAEARQLLEVAGDDRYFAARRDRDRAPPGRAPRAPPGRHRSGHGHHQDRRGDEAPQGWTGVGADDEDGAVAASDRGAADCRLRPPRASPPPARGASAARARVGPARVPHGATGRAVVGGLGRDRARVHHGGRHRGRSGQLPASLFEAVPAGRPRPLAIPTSSATPRPR
ncbi:MAG: tyrosine-type recombinase/integrase [Acidimicrobiales bacterium]